MNKKLIGLLLVLAMVIGLLPVMAVAEDPVLTETVRVMGTTTDLTASTDGKCTYAKNVTVELTNSAGGTFTGTEWEIVASNTLTEPAEWNLKFEFPKDGVPTLTLKGAILDYYDEANGVYNKNSSTAPNTAIAGKDDGTVRDLNIVIAADSYIATGLRVVDVSANYGNVTISSVGDAKLTAYQNGYGIGSNKALTLNNANIDITLLSYATSTGHPLYAKGDITINGGNVNVTYNPEMTNTGNGIKAGGNIIINDGKITVNAGGSASATNGAIIASKKIIINGGEVRVEKTKICGYYATEGVEINGGYVYASGSYYGFGKCPVVVKGGAVEGEMKGKNATINSKDKFDISGYDCFTAVAGTSKDDAAAVADLTDANSYYKKYIKITPHALTETIAKEASCKEDGNIQFWSCEKCGKYYSDAAGATEITDKSSVKIDAATVDCKPEADDGDCTTAIKCSVCGKEATPAKASHTAGTWTDGKTNCTECGKEMTCAHTGGTATCEKKAVCTTCGLEYGELAAHTPAEDDGDCTTAVKCSVCGEDARPAGTHTGGTATCKEKAKCTNCGQEYGELGAHTPAEDDGDCTTAIKCTVCGAETTAAKKHVEEVIPGKPATKTETGLTEGKKCSTCGKILVAQKEIAKLPADGTNGNPATGDSHIAVWMGLMAVSAAAFVSIVVMGKKKIA